MGRNFRTFPARHICCKRGGTCGSSERALLSALWLQCHGRLCQHHNPQPAGRGNKRTRSRHVRLLLHSEIQSLHRNTQRNFTATIAGQVDRSNGNREGSEFWLANEFAQLQWSASSHWSVGANADMTQSKANNPGTTQSPLLSMWTKDFQRHGIRPCQQHI